MQNSPELKQLLDLLSKKEKLTAMLAPSFPIDFSYPEIIGKLKRTGFSFVVEIAVGAAETNRQVLEFLSKDPKSRVITSPCPAFVRFLKSEYPRLLPYLIKADSPMTATAKVVKKKFPQTKPVFIGPCLVKKLEAKDNPDLNILAITYKELQQVFEILKIKDSTEDYVSTFDLAKSKTRLYPISGGLSQSAGLEDMFTDEEYKVVSGLNLLKEALENFEKDTKIKVLDILFCEGGCISGPGVISQESLEKRRQAVVRYWVTHLPSK